MNMKDCQAGRARGMELALDIVKKDGIRAQKKRERKRQKRLREA